MRPKEAAKMLAVSTKTLWRWAKEGRIKFVKLPSGRLRFPASEIAKITGAVPSLSISSETTVGSVLSKLRHAGILEDINISEDEDAIYLKPKKPPLNEMELRKLNKVAMTMTPTGRFLSTYEGFVIPKRTMQ